MEATNQELTHEKMIIVGNGFDMSAKIKSSYRDFINYIKAEEKLETNEEVYNFNKLFLQKFDGKDLNWNDLESIFESHIKEINSTTYNNDDEIRSRYSISEVNNCLSNLEELFFDYLEETYQDRMNVVKSEINQNKIFVNNVYEDIFSNASVINFNYTSTLFDLGLLENIKKRNLIDKNNSFSKINYYQLHGSIR
ncbi:MAG: AbiH family protein, partial [Streptococcus salivarius]|nr:AbiH family protein [Streptococcus salivarius]